MWLLVCTLYAIVYAYTVAMVDSSVVIYIRLNGNIEEQVK